MNPFQIKDRSELAGFAAPIEKLKMRMLAGNNIVLMGVRGAGKTTVLQSMFNREARKNYAKGAPMGGKLRRLLAVRIEMSVFAESDQDTWSVFTGELRDQVPRILMELEDEEAKQALEDIEQEWGRQNPSNVFRYVMEKLDSHGFTVLLLMDHFQNFCEPKYAPRHTIFRSMLDSDQAQVIAVTDESLDKLYLDSELHGSLLVQRLNTTVTLTGITREELSAYLDGKLEGTPVVFSAELIENIYIQTGGVFPLVKKMAELCYDRLERDLPEDPEAAGRDCIRRAGEEDFLPAVLDEVHAEMDKTMEGWIAPLIKKMGDHWQEWQAIDLLLEQADREDRPAVRRVPGSGENTFRHAVEVLTDRGIFVQLEAETGSRYRFNSPILQTYVKRWRERKKKEIFAAIKTGGLYQELAAIKAWLGVREGGDPVSRFLDEYYASLALEDKRTIEEKFEEAIRHSSRPLTLAWMEEMELGEKARYYLEVAVLDEERMKEGRPALAGDTDCSSLTNLYGKALEVHLTDVLQGIFEGNCAMIGVLRTTLEEAIPSMVELSEELWEQGRLPENMEETKNDTWWRDLCSGIGKAGRIRNSGDHGNLEYPVTEDLDEMVDLLLGVGETMGIFEKCKMVKKAIDLRKEKEEGLPSLSDMPVWITLTEKGKSKRNLRGVLPQTEETLEWLKSVFSQDPTAWQMISGWEGGWNVTIPASVIKDCEDQKTAKLSRGGGLRADLQKLLDLVRVEVVLERWDKNGSCFVARAFFDPSALPDNAFDTAASLLG